VSADRESEYALSLAEPMPEPFGVLWERLWHARRAHGEPKWVALFTSWRDARAISKAAA
jgi:hypothetical protein